MGQAPIYVEIDIAADIDTVWRLTQVAENHTRWDLRFSRISPTETLDSEGYRFRYERRIPFHTITGTGTSRGEIKRPDGTRTSALKFTTKDRLSPLGDGRGYWRYVPIPGGTRFITGYDYEPAWGAVLDRILIRPFVGWMTAWSFDSLRLWAESDIEPHSPLAFWKPGRPRARNCLRFPRRGRPMDDAPATLSALETP
ncbi:SRPBCC family protein [Salinibacterium sp. SWN1162]|uniref:SRPBCC family protein n=1 Tax=Salinibacterium sp. SWN1162 TaxID=2792053 RepID=UPI0018CE251C|nr:SRPBCC family protein [Salinibacterium sp. SWN1162]MBH0008535.1 SRPBCC family protein [Salinibacterium sp. SWN1162]